MLTAAELDDARDDLEAELIDTVTVWRDTGARALDDATLEELPVWAAVYLSVPALIVPEGRNDRPATQAGEPALMRTYVVTLPVAVQPQEGHIVVVDESYDAATVGLALTVREPRHGSVSISRKVVVQENLTVARFIPEVS